MSYITANLKLLNLGTCLPGYSIKFSMPKKTRAKTSFVSSKKKRVGYVSLEEIDVVLSDLDLSLFVFLHFFQHLALAMM